MARIDRAGESFEVALRRCLVRCIEEKRSEFQHDRFFKEWFKEHGNAYFFLFKKNLHVTNIQFGELLALMRRHIAPVDGSEGYNLQFVSSRRFGRVVEGFVRPYLDGKGNDMFKEIEEIISLYGRLLRRLVVVSPYFGSAAVFLPINLALDLAAVCGASGYIHSCGRNIFVRNVNKANRVDFVDALERHLKRFPPRRGVPISLAVYAHEDFTKWDGKMRGELYRGLDEVKVYVEKLYMGEERLVSVLGYIRDRFAGELEIPEPGNYWERHKRLLENMKIDGTRTLWLIQDKSVGTKDLQQPGYDRYYICYDQQYSNGNPFHIFDENKPAWIDHTTIPHTLMGAMINLTSPSWAHDRSVLVGDPFVGSGTTLLECLKFEGVISYCSDINPVAELLTRDNLEIFCSSSERIGNFMEDLERIKESKQAVVDLEIETRKRKKPAHIVLKIGDGRLRLPVTSEYGDLGIVLGETHISQLKKLRVRDRVFLYIAFRVLRRNVGAFLREHLDWDSRYADQAEELMDQMKRLHKVRVRYEKCAESVQGQNICVTPGSYSNQTTANFKELQLWLEGARLVGKKDIKEGFGRRKFDVIVADPPYGFNTDEELTDLADLYVRMIRSLIGSLREDGHLVLCLPERSYIGRRSPDFTHREFVTQQILSVADEFDLEVFNPGRAVPAPEGLFWAPYYWESDKALARNIVHFRFRSRYHARATEKWVKDGQLSLSFNPAE